MKQHLLLWVGWFVILLIGGCAAPPRDTLTQISTIDALLAGVYDGETTIGELARYGDTGIGTFSRLDGELAMYQGVVYQIRSDGVVRRAEKSMTTPFATVVQFAPTHRQTLPSGMNRQQFYQWLDREASNPNLFVAIVVEGTFQRVRARSVPAQNKPYQPLAQIIDAQSYFDFGGDEPVRGVLVGFRCPEYVRGLNVPSYHLHFLSDDRTRGGHILDFTIDQAHVRWQEVHRFVVNLPQAHENFSAADLSRDRRDELKKVEQQ